MIITRTPVRIPIGGGGTDLPSYYSKYEGFLVTAAIDKYTYLTVDKRFESTSRLTYSKMEMVDKISEIKHPIIREACDMLNIEMGIEIHSLANIPSSVGLGTSSSFTVGLLHALHIYKRDYVSLKTLAEEACSIEIDRLGEPIGKQDQYIAAFGGIICMEIDKNGEVTITPLKVSNDIIEELESNILLFYTGIRRNASIVLKEQKEKEEKDDKTVIGAMHEIKDIGKEIKLHIEKGNLSEFGSLLDKHWNVKKRLSKKVSNEEIDKWYEIAKMNGALGGKIMGAGGGGFFMFYCESNKQALRKAMKGEGLREVRFRFDFEGTKTIGHF